MQVPLELSFRDTKSTESVREYIDERVADLEDVCNSITSCRIAVEEPHRHEGAAKSYRVRIDVRVPHGHEVVVEEKTSDRGFRETLPEILARAFDTTRRQLKALAERQRGDVKRHAD
jgi:ribosome-associated translation inhibitor RaiA